MYTILKKTKHKTDQIELIIEIVCLLNGKKLSKTELTVLAHYIHYGVKSSTDEMLIGGKFIKETSLRNVKTRLKNLGYLKRSELYSSYELNMKDVKFPNQFNLLIKLDNS